MRKKYSVSYPIIILFTLFSCIKPVKRAKDISEITPYKGQPFTYDEDSVEDLEIDNRVSASAITLNRKATGFRGIWHGQAAKDGTYKYAGGLGTYPAKHRPFAIYAEKVNKTFFCYGGATDDNNEHLLHMVSSFDHSKKNVERPTIILDKLTGDAHDNPVISLDDKGYIWIFSTAHGAWRPSYIHKSVRPYDISEFEYIHATKLENGRQVPMDNFSYLQVWHLKEKGFIAFFSSYDDADGKIVDEHGNAHQRTICYMISTDGKAWSEWITLGAIEEGHYQISKQTAEKAGTAFNFHPLEHGEESKYGLDYRTNLYYIETDDLGKTWQSVDGQTLKIPLIEKHNPAFVYDYQSEGLLVYLKDIEYDASGNPVILYITSKGFQSGPENDPRTWHIAKWNGKNWQITDLTTSDHNYDMGSLFLSDKKWQIIAPNIQGPQKYNPGGEVAIWESHDQGISWKLEKQLTSNSSRNHSYVRKPLYAKQELVALWADGHANQVSTSNIFLANSQGEVFKLPEEMVEDVIRLEKLKMKQ